MVRQAMRAVLVAGAALVSATAQAQAAAESCTLNVLTRSATVQLGGTFDITTGILPVTYSATVSGSTVSQDGQGATTMTLTFSTPLEGSIKQMTQTQIFTPAKGLATITSTETVSGAANHTCTLVTVAQLQQLTGKTPTDLFQVCLGQECDAGMSFPTYSGTTTESGQTLSEFTGTFTKPQGSGQFLVDVPGGCIPYAVSGTLVLSLLPYTQVKLNYQYRDFTVGGAVPAGSFDIPSDCATLPSTEVPLRVGGIFSPAHFAAGLALQRSQSQAVEPLAV